MQTNPMTRRTHKNSELAFLIVVIASFVVTFTAGGLHFRTSYFIALGLGVVYTATGIFGSRYLESGVHPTATAVYFVVQVLLAASIIYLSQGNAWLIIMPVVGSAVEYLKRPLAVAVCLVVWAAMMIPFWLLGGATAALGWSMPFLAAVVFVAVFTNAVVSEANARAELARANQKLREYAAQVEELAVVQERNRLAREIHDGLGHYLTAIDIQLKAAQAMAAQDAGSAQTALQNAQTLTGEALADVRRSISSLRSDPSTSRPLVESLNLLLAETRAADLQASLAVSGTPRPLPQQVEFTLYRVAQEGLTNVHKHANASRVELHLDYRERGVRLSIADNGAGASEAEGGFGLLGLQERVQLVGGSLHVETSPGAGFRLEADLPTG